MRSTCAGSRGQLVRYGAGRGELLPSRRASSLHIVALASLGATSSPTVLCGQTIVSNVRVAEMDYRLPWDA